MDWDRFDFEYRLELQGTNSEIVTIEAYKEAALNLVLPPDWREHLNRLNRIRAIHGTTALEGNPLSEAEVSQQINVEGQPSQLTSNPNREQIQIRNAGAAQEWVKERFHPGREPIGISDILLIHKMVTENSDFTNNTPGRFRAFPVTVGSNDIGGVHRGAPHDRVPQLMEEYVRFVNSRTFMKKHPVIRALLAHFFLVTIHPFGDGNGRTSRLVEAGILFQEGYNVHGFYGLSNYFYRNERDYKTFLQQCRNAQPFNVTPFVTFGIRGFSSELKGINNFIKAKLNRVVYRSMLIRAYRQRAGKRRRLINRREYNLLDFLITETEPTDPFSEHPSRRISYAELKESPYIRAAYRSVTPRTFLRELLRLGELGFITFAIDTTSKEPIIELDFGAIGKY